jgi:hypothetical protein
LAEKPGKKGSEELDDPIAYHIAIRMKAGSLNSTISQADAKKMGLITTIPTAKTSTKVVPGKDLKPGKVPANKEN